MWRRFSSHLQILCGSSFKPNFRVNRTLLNSATSFSPAAPSQFLRPASLFSRHASSDSVVSQKGKTVEDVMPIATGHEREEIEADLQGRDLSEIDQPVGPFGTKEAPSIVKSVYNKRIVGCPGGEGEDEHDVVWFWLEKDKPHECPVCSQYFKLEVVGPGGPPPGEDDEDEHGHH